MKNLLILFFILMLFQCKEETIAPKTPDVKFGQSYLNGRVMYLFTPTDKGYVKGQTHGLILSNELGKYSWDSAFGACLAQGWTLPSKEDWLLIMDSRLMSYDDLYWTSVKYSSTNGVSVNPFRSQFTTNLSVSTSLKVVGIKQF